MPRRAFLLLLALASLALLTVILLLEGEHSSAVGIAREVGDVPPHEQPATPDPIEGPGDPKPERAVIAASPSDGEAAGAVRTEDGEEHGPPISADDDLELTGELIAIDASGQEHARESGSMAVLS